MSKRVKFIRHGEAYHNIGIITGIDPKLTLKGIADSKNIDLEDFVPELILVSPFTRTLQTATFAFESLINKIPWIALDSLRERNGGDECDIMKPVDTKINLYPYVDFDNISDISTHNTIGHIEQMRSIINRCKELIDFIKHREESNIVVVTHGGYLLTLCAVLKLEDKSLFVNCEIREVIL